MKTGATVGMRTCYLEAMDRIELRVEYQSGE
jgi:hypothetical protein